MTRIGSTPTLASSSVRMGFRVILPSAAYRGGRLFYSAGFSLLELLLVLFIMGLMTATTMFMTGGVEDQSKYDETKRRMELIKRAIVGDPTRTVNGGPEISGFVADMGRLPVCMQELLEMSNSTCDTHPPLDEWKVDEVTGLGRGWRGPYLDVSTDSDGTRHFRDGYGCDWGFSIASSAVQIQSHGADCVAGGSGNMADIPTSGVMTLVDETDYRTQDTIIINFYNQSATSAVTINPTNWMASLEATSAVTPAVQTAFKIDGGTSAVDIAPGGNLQAEATFDSKLLMGVYLMDVICTSCVNVNNDITHAYQIALVPRHQIPSFKWVITPQ